MTKENKLQEALHVVAEHYADLLQDYRNDYAEDETDEQLRNMIARAKIVIEEMQKDLMILSGDC